MRKAFIRATLCCALVLSVSVAFAQPPVRHVIIISVDGMMPETYLNPDARGLQVATLREIVKNGAYSEGALGVFPTVTYPSHTSMVTGVNPARHGIATNPPWDPMYQMGSAMRWYTEDIRVPTLWDAAREKGLRTALIYWPVTVGAKVTYIVPEFWRTDAETPEDAKLLRAISTPGLLEAVARRFLNFWKGIHPPRMADESLADVAVHLIETERPHLLLLHMFDVDHTQHNHGPFSPEGNAALEVADRQIGRVIAAAKQAGIWEQTALIVVSDHGFVGYKQRVRPGVWLRERGLLTFDDRNRARDWKAAVTSNGGSAFFYVKDQSDAETKEAIRKLLTEKSAETGSGVGKLYSQEEIRALGADNEAFMAAEAADGFYFDDGYTGDWIRTAREGAAGHGYDPRRADLKTSLLFYGPGIGQGKIADARLIDVAPTVARWLGLQMNQMEGRPLEIPAPRRAAAAPK